MDTGSYFAFWEFLILGCSLITLIGAKLFFSFVSNNETIKKRIQNFEHSVLAVIMYLIIGTGMLISFLLIVPFFLLVIITGLSISVFIPKVRKIRGRIIRIKRKESLVYFFSDYNSNSADNGLMLMPVYQNASPYKEIEHLVFLEEEESQKKYFMDLPSKLFDEVEKKRSSGLKNNLFLYFKKYLFFEVFDHFELEPV